MDHKWGRNVFALGVGSSGATLAARLNPGTPDHRCLTNEHQLEGFATLWTLPDMASDDPYSLGLVPTGGMGFPYGFNVEPDARV